MLLGKADAKLDEKGRMVLPVLFRGQLNGALFFALGDSNEIAIWPEEAFRAKVEEKKELERTLGAEGTRELRRFTFHASTVKLDAQHRVLIPELLRDKAGIAPNASLTVMGSFDRVEIWESSQLEEYLR